MLLWSSSWAFLLLSFNKLTAAMALWACPYMAQRRFAPDARLYRWGFLGKQGFRGKAIVLTQVRPNFAQFANGLPAPAAAAGRAGPVEMEIQHRQADG
jgi:hypothetical protein